MRKEGWEPAWHRQDFEIQKENLSHDGVFQVLHLRLRHRLFSGEWSKWLHREYIRRRGAAAIVLFDPVRQKVVMVEQFRVGLIQQTDHSPWMLEIVAGLIEEGESTEDTIHREAEEEAGCTLKNTIRIGDFYNTPGGFCEKTTLYYGEVDSEGIEGIHGALTEEEDILVHVLSPEWVFEAIEQGKIVTSASTMIGLQWLRRQLELGK